MSSSKLDVQELERIARAATPGPRHRVGRGIWGDERSVVYAYAEAACGRPEGDYYRCGGPSKEAFLKVSPEDEAFLFSFTPETVLRLLAERKALVEALRPFSEAVDSADDERAPDHASTWESSMAMAVSFGDFRRARAALALTGGGQS